MKVNIKDYYHAKFQVLVFEKNKGGGGRPNDPTQDTRLNRVKDYCSYLLSFQFIIYLLFHLVGVSLIDKHKHVNDLMFYNCSNCLFRALADQLNGDDKMHSKHRKEVVEYMKQHKDDFAPFLDESITFEKYCK